VIIDLPKFVNNEQPSWQELEELLDSIEASAGRKLSMEKAMRLHYLYQKTCADLAKLRTFASEPELRGYLESLVGRAYAEIHETRDSRLGFRPFHYFLNRFPQAFCRRLPAFWLATAMMLAGALFGGFAVTLDTEAKLALVPAQFAHLMQDPSERVADEESTTQDHMAGQKATFSSFLMANNIRVAILSLALGATWGIGTLFILFYNGVILGMVGADYIAAGESVFLMGWLLPHGVIEIPALLIGGQAGLVLARALIGRGDRTPLGQRVRAVGGDLCALVFGLALLLVWAGLVEAFLSQYHYPIIPYWAKIGFGGLELLVLVLLLARGFKLNREAKRNPEASPA